MKKAKGSAPKGVVKAMGKGVGKGEKVVAASKGGKEAGVAPLKMKAGGSKKGPVKSIDEMRERISKRFGKK